MKRGGFAANYRRPPEGRDGEDERDGDEEEREGDEDGRDGETDGRDGETDGRDGDVDGREGDVDGREGWAGETDGREGWEGETDGREGWAGETDGRDGLGVDVVVVGREFVVRGVESTCGVGVALGRLGEAVWVIGAGERPEGRTSLGFVPGLRKSR